MSSALFTHSPTATFDHEETGSYEQAKEGVDRGEAEGIGFAFTRHDELLVLEADPAIEDGKIAAPIAAILDQLGETYTERDDGTTARAIYSGSFPESFTDAGQWRFRLAIQDDATTRFVRVYNRGWTPISEERMERSTRDLRDVSPDGLARVLALSQRGGSQ
jgi:hypothetical protein